MRHLFVRFIPLALLFGFCLATSGRAQDGPLTFDLVTALAQRLAAQPYKDVPPIEGDMRQLSYDHYRALRARSDKALWGGTKSLFHVEFFPAGFIYDKPVKVSIIEHGKESTAFISPDEFDFSDTGLKTPPKELTLAGFKLTHPLNRQDKFDEVAAFLGASYFRAVGRGQVYGASARGLAIDTATGKPEEFPTFRQFWILRPVDGKNTITVWALLDSPSATGAYAFDIVPGNRTVVDCHAVLFMRNDVGLLAIAPLTSMFFAGKASPPRNDYRPEIHDSDGLYVSTGAGERLWRPLQNPAALAISSFSDTNPKGFGLLQRERDFNQYQDSAARLERRPGLWIEPKAGWGDGEVRLVEIPSQSETNDNIVAFWVSRWPAKKGERKEYDYRISSLDDEATLSPQARVVATRAGAVSNADNQRRFVIEFQGGKLASLPADQKVEANVSLSAGKLKRSYVEALPAQRAWRLFLEVEPDQKKPVDMRAFLTLGQQPMSETWSMVWQP
jgi:glucans biosynthesis protein